MIRLFTSLAFGHPGASCLQLERGPAPQGTDSVAVVPGLSCSEYRIFPDQGSSLCLWHRQQSLPLSRQGRPQGLSPCDAPHNPITSLGCYLATPLRCPHPDGPLGEPWTLSAPRLQGRGWALPSQDITVSGSPPCSQERSRGLFERGVPGRGWMREDPGGGQSPGPSRAGGRGASHQPFPGVSVGHVTPGVTPLAAAQAVGHD